MIALENVTVRAGEFALREVSFSVASGSYAALMGATACGKTTLLEVICGLRAPGEGRVLLMGEDATAWPPGARGIGYMPQDAALFTALSVAENIGFALRMRGWSTIAILRRVADLAEMVGVADLLERSVGGLSGGETQRVALARALAPSPPILCLDEPLSALDEETREGMQELLRRVHERLAPTVLHVTHSPAEAAALASVVLEMREGRVRVTQQSQ